jgi:CDGSH-type Zn-finger protein
MGDCDITVRPNGPLLVQGKGITLKDAAGNVYDLAGREAISLCRCGLSAKKPFCDGAHRTGNFAAESKAVALPPPPPKPQA